MALSPETCNGIALCAGAGGLELGLSLAVPIYRTVCWVERDAYAASALVARMEDAALDDAPVWSDVRSFDGRAWRGKVDILSAGYPCQPFSSSGKRKGEKDPRHLWPHVRRVLDECGAPFLFAENVQGHVSLGLETVWRDLRDMGFKVEAGIFSAAEVGAPHVRKRLFILAHAHDQALRRLAEHIHAARPSGAGQGPVPTGFSGSGGSLDPALPDGHERTQGVFPPDAGAFDAWESWLAARPDLQPAVYRGSDGLADRLDRHRLAGNGVVPLAAAYALATLTAATCRRK